MSQCIVQQRTAIYSAWKDSLVARLPRLTRVRTTSPRPQGRQILLANAEVLADFGLSTQQTESVGFGTWERDVYESWYVFPPPPSSLSNDTWPLRHNPLLHLPPSQHVMCRVQLDLTGPGLFTQMVPAFEEAPWVVDEGVCDGFEEEDLSTGTH